MLRRELIRHLVGPPGHLPGAVPTQDPYSEFMRRLLLTVLAGAALALAGCSSPGDVSRVTVPGENSTWEGWTWSVVRDDASHAWTVTNYGAG